MARFSYVPEKVYGLPVKEVTGSFSAYMAAFRYPGREDADTFTYQNMRLINTRKIQRKNLWKMTFSNGMDTLHLRVDQAPNKKDYEGKTFTFEVHFAKREPGTQQEGQL